MFLRMIGFLLAVATTCDALSTPPSTTKTTPTTRRAWLSQAASMAVTSTSALIGVSSALVFARASPAIAADAVAEAVQEAYDNPNIPPGPEERSGLVVLRIAEVAQFQEKILRAVANGDIPDVVVTPQQIVFGTQILMRNSNIAGNMKLMISEEIPRARRRDANAMAANVMNTLQAVSSQSAKIQRPFEKDEMIEIADLYRLLRVELNGLYELLAESERDKYYGYFVAVTEYEKKLADGVYNPELDGVLKFDYAK